jgi:hypothetical protein
MSDDQFEFRLTEAQLTAIQAMTAGGMPISLVAEALQLPEEIVKNQRREWLVGRIERERIAEIETELFAPRECAKTWWKENFPDLSAKQRAFLAAYVVTGGNRTEAAAAVPVERTLTYRWEHEPQFSQALEEADRQAIDVLVDTAVKEAKGVLEPIFNRAGELIGHRIRRSGQLLLAAIARKRPEWRHHISAELTGKDGGPIETKPALPDWLLDVVRPPEPPAATDTL